MIRSKRAQAISYRNGLTPDDGSNIRLETTAATVQHLAQASLDDLDSTLASSVSFLSTSADTLVP